MSRKSRHYGIPGTTIFDGAQAWKGYALNKMWYSFNSAANRAEFPRDEDACCARYGPNEAQRRAIRDCNVLKLIGSVEKTRSNYHIPISNTATGMLVLENCA